MAPLPLGKLLQRTAPLAPLSLPASLFLSPFCCEVWLSNSVGGVAGWCGRMSLRSQMPPPVREVSRMKKSLAPLNTSVFVLFAYHRCAAAALASMIVCQSASSSAWEWVSQVSWLSDVLSWDQQKRRHLPVMCQVLSRQTDANESGKCVTFRYAPPLSCAPVSPLTNTDWQNILSVFEYGCRTLTTVWDVNEELVNSQHLFRLLSEYKSLSERTAKQLRRDIMIYELWLYCQL